MKFFTSILLALGLAIAPLHAASAKTTAGVVGAFPETFGLYVSHFPIQELSVDGWLTLSTVDGGLSTYLPLGDNDGVHSLVFTGLVGYNHDLVPIFPHRSLHVVGAAGYSWQSPRGWDIRAQAGVVAAHNAVGRFAPGFHGHVQVGHAF